MVRVSLVDGVVMITATSEIFEKYPIAGIAIKTSDLANGILTFVLRTDLADAKMKTWKAYNTKNGDLKRITFRSSIIQHFRKDVKEFGLTAAESVSSQAEGILEIKMPPAALRNRPRKAPRLKKPAPAPIIAAEPPVAENVKVDGTLAQSVRAINNLKAELGDSLILSITADGALRALVEFS